MHRFSVLFSHFVQVIVPFGLFAPQPYASIAGGLIIFHQLWLIISGNYSWLNWLTVALGITAFSDSVLLVVVPIRIPPTVVPSSFTTGVLYVIGAAAVLLSIQPTMNLFSKRQLMNHSYNRLHLINTYGAFGSVTRKRYEVVIEGTDDAVITEHTRWQEYGFKAKPGDLKRMPPQIAPYHLRLDWLMWFLPFSAMPMRTGVFVPRYEVWFVRLLQKLLANDQPALKLLKQNPFKNNPPKFIHALFYEYRYTDWREWKQTGARWSRRLIGEYFPAVSMNDFE
jgi:hypothetical protein